MFLVNARTLQELYLDAWRHGNVEVTEHMLAVFILGGLAKERQKSSGLFTAVSHLRHTNTRNAMRTLMQRGDGTRGVLVCYKK